MTAKSRSSFIGVAAFLLLNLPGGSWAAESPCKENLIKVCQEQADNPVCTLVRGSGHETPQSIYEFLSSLDHLADDLREKIICARLVGRSQIDNFETPAIPLLSTIYHSASADSGGCRWNLQLNAPYREFSKEFLHLDSLTEDSLGKEATLHFTGKITRVAVAYRYSAVNACTITVADVEVSEIDTSIAKGVTVADQIKELKVRIAAQYRGYMQKGKGGTDHQ